MAWDILIKNCKGLVQVRDKNSGPLSGKFLDELPIVANAYLAIEQGKIVGYGPMSELPGGSSAISTIDASGRFVFPSYVDSHTHLIFAASREEEFVMKIKAPPMPRLPQRVAVF